MIVERTQRQDSTLEAFPRLDDAVPITRTVSHSNMVVVMGTDPLLATEAERRETLALDPARSVPQQTDHLFEAVLERVSMTPGEIPEWEQESNVAAALARQAANGVVLTKEESQMSLDDFELGRPVGRGSFGFNFLAREKRSKAVVCLKACPMAMLADAESELDILRGADIQCSLDHPHVVCMYGTFTDLTTSYFILEYTPGGSLRELLEASPGLVFPHHKAAKCILDVANALVYLQSHDIIHRDLKPENLVMGHAGRVKVAEFASAVIATTPQTLVCGTLGYQAPEMISGLPYGCEVDVWALGIILYEFLYGVPPFYTQDSDLTNRYIVHNSANFNEMPPMPSDAIDLMRDLLIRNAAERLLLSEILEDPWILHCVLTPPQ